MANIGDVEKQLLNVDREITALEKLVERKPGKRFSDYEVRELGKRQSKLKYLKNLRKRLAKQLTALRAKAPKASNFPRLGGR